MKRYSGRSRRRDCKHECKEEQGEHGRVKTVTFGQKWPRYVPQAIHDNANPYHDRSHASGSKYSRGNEEAR
jgi:hypothetical protein